MRMSTGEPLTALRGRRTYMSVAGLVFAAFLLATLLRFVVAEPFVVSGDSMQPAYDSGDYLIVDRLAYRFAAPQPGDVVVFQYPLDPSLYFIKRIDALPGDTVDESTGLVVPAASSSAARENPYAGHEPGTLTLAPDEYFVLGDNRSASSDSRAWGPLEKKFIIGRVVMRAWPLTRG